MLHDLGLKMEAAVVEPIAIIFIPLDLDNSACAAGKR
jgi:hypothetical protein